MDSRLLQFETFLREIGIKFDKKAISFVKSNVQGYGVEASVDIPKGKVVATIPKTAVLSVETASLWKEINKGEKFPPQLQSSAAESKDDAEESSEHHPRDRWCPPLFQLPAAALFEALRGTESPWYRYISIFPTSLAEIGVPMAESDEKISQVFQGTAIDKLTEKMRTDIDDTFNQSIRALFKHRASQLGMKEDIVQNVTVEKFALAFAWVTSRAFQVDDVHDNSLVPIADMFNHQTDGEHVHIEGVGDSSGSDDDSESEEQDDENDVSDVRKGSTAQNGGKTKKNLRNTKDTVNDDDLSIMCVRKVSAGEEIFNTFGQKCNTVLYLNYGFTEDDNSYETAFIHKDDVNSVLDQLIAEETSANRQMTPERKACIHSCEFVTDHDVIDDFFQISMDGSFCQSLVLLLYLYFVPWNEISDMAEDEFEMMKLLMELSVSDVLKTAPKQIFEAIKRLACLHEETFPPGTSIESDEKALTNISNLTHLELAALRIRLGQRRAMKIACEQLHSIAEGISDIGNYPAFLGDDYSVSEPQTKRAKGS